MMRVSRHEVILDLLAARGAMRIAELETELGASSATLRRDLAQLEELGKLRRTFGGAMAFDTPDDPFAAVLLVNANAKRAIAKAAVGQVEDHQTIILDVGTTVHYLAAELVHRPLTIITGSVTAFELFAGSPETKIILLGGEYVAEYRCLTGFMAVDSLQNLHADQAFLGCSGLSNAGDIRDTTASQIPVKRAILESSETSTLLVDSAKFPGHGSSTVAAVGVLDQIITDAQLTEPLSMLCQASDTDVVQV